MAGSALQSLTNAAIVLVSGAELRALALASPRITQAFWVYSAVDAAVLARWAVNLARREAKIRMAHFRCEIGLRMEASGQGDRTDFLLELTQAQMGDALGLSAVHVNRTLKALKEIGAVEIEGRIFRIPDWSRLTAIAEFDPEYLQILAPAEQALAAGDAVRLPNLFWTAKEAAAKVCREGLRLDLRQAVTRLRDEEAGGWRALVVEWREGPSTRGWWRESDGYVMTVAREPGGPPPIDRA